MAASGIETMSQYGYDSIQNHIGVTAEMERRNQQLDTTQAEFVTGKSSQEETIITQYFSEGTSLSVSKSEKYSEEDPIYRVTCFKSDGTTDEVEINASKVDPSNASYLETLVLMVDGEDLVPGASDLLKCLDSIQSYEDLFSQRDYTELLMNYEGEQLNNGNYHGYLKSGQVYTYLQKFVSEIIEPVSHDEAEEKEESVQIGNSSFNKAEWDRLIRKVDQSIEQIKKEQEEQVKRKEKLKEEERQLEKKREYKEQIEKQDQKQLEEEQKIQKQDEKQREEEQKIEKQDEKRTEETQKI